MQNLTEMDYIQAKQVMYNQGLDPKLTFDPENVAVVGSEEHVRLFEEVAEPIITKRLQEEQKLVGVEFEGKFYSATKQDQNGLTAVFLGLANNMVTSAMFQFSNGQKLLLTSDNYIAFGQVWAPFRQSFFAE